jgi:hypothetical protein
VGSKKKAMGAAGRSASASVAWILEVSSGMYRFLLTHHSLEVSSYTQPDEDFGALNHCYAVGVWPGKGNRKDVVSAFCSFTAWMMDGFNPAAATSVKIDQLRCPLQKKLCGRSLIFLTHQFVSGWRLFPPVSHQKLPNHITGEFPPYNSLI